MTSHPIHFNALERISGPPGTGKTTHLLGLVDQCLKSGIPPEEIAYVSFTKAAAREARERAIATFKLSPDRFPFFRTLHSTAFSLLPRPIWVMSNHHLCSFGSLMGLSFTLSSNAASLRGYTKGDVLLSFVNMAAASCISIQELYSRREEWGIMSRIPGYEIEHFANSYQTFKQDRMIIDFNDMLAHCLENPCALPIKVMMIDEAQDLSILQWRVATRMAEKAERVWIAGDDDQAIHEWNGASVKTFIDLSARDTVLPVSYRLPKEIHDLADRVVSRISTRIPKPYTSKPETGFVIRHRNTNTIDLTRHKGTWLLLARNLCFLAEYEQLCRRLNVIYQSDVLNVESEEYLEAIGLWEALRAGKRITKANAQLVYAMMSTRDRISYGAKKQLGTLPDDALLTLDDLVSKHGLQTTKPWQYAFDSIPNGIKTYLLKAESQGELFKTPRVRITTIHGAKGAEADNVVLMLDMTTRTHDGYRKMPDQEHRVFYVGVTRAKETLHIIEPATNLFYEL